MNDRLEPAGHHAGWEVWVLVEQRLDARCAAAFATVTGARRPLAILLRRGRETRAFALAAELEEPERLARRIRRARRDI